VLKHLPCARVTLLRGLHQAAELSDSRVGAGLVALRARAIGPHVAAVSASAAVPATGAAARAPLVAVVATGAVPAIAAVIVAPVRVPAASIKILEEVEQVLDAPLVLTVPVGVAVIPVPMLVALFDALLQPLKAVQDLFEFLFDATPAAGIGSRPRGRSCAFALGEDGADEGEDGECCDSSHFAFVTPDCIHMFRESGTSPIIGAVKRIDHVGIAVPDLAEARRQWDLVLGQEPQTDEVPTQKVSAAMYPCGIELVAPTADDSPISKFLGKRGTGIHHVTLEVEDIDAHLARLKAAGVRLINETPTPGHGGCRVAFLHPAATGGVLVELKESK